MAAVADKTEAQNAIFTHIVEGLEQASRECGGAARAEAIKNLALAYRLAAGGTQPGSAVLTK